MKKTNNGIYVGRWLNEDNNFIYTVAQIQDVERTIPEYGTPHLWTEAQQVLCFGKSKIYKKEDKAMDYGLSLLNVFLNCRGVEEIFYDSFYPKQLSMQKAIDFITGYSKEEMIAYLNGELED